MQFFCGDVAVLPAEKEFGQHQSLPRRPQACLAQLG
jgi:hypothetical protein